MKKLKCLLPFLLILCLLCACSGGKENSSLIDSYRTAAQNYIDAGDPDSAKAALEEGIERTGDASLQEMLTKLLEGTLTQATTEESTTEEPPTEEPTTEPTTTQTTAAPAPENLLYGLTWDNTDSDFIEYLNSHRIFDDENSTIAGQATIENPWNNPYWFYTTYEGEHYLLVEYSVASEDGYSFYEVVFREIDATYAEVVEFWHNSTMLDKQTTEIYLNEWENCWKAAQNRVQAVDLTDQFSAKDRYRINIFLSNFSEIYFDDLDTGDYRALVSYAVLHSSINNFELFTYDPSTYSYMISENDVNKMLDRFFGFTISHSSIGSIDSAGIIKHKNGYYYYSPAAGEFNGYVSIVNGMYKNSDGTYHVTFDVYAVDYDTYYENGVSSDYYYMTSSEAASSRYLNYSYSGTAQVRDYDGGSYQSYQLLQYDID